MLCLRGESVLAEILFLYFLGSHIIFRVEKTASDYVVSDLEGDGRYKVLINAVSEGGVSSSRDIIFVFSRFPYNI